ncbi:MAG: transcription elongation factor GreA, partial [Chloroflexi bacterium]|nr:transcription elongation factor GreA [Chloroflexota bacterium]
MIKKSFNLTPAKKAALEKELADLIAERPAIKERIAIARSFGDLSENEDYSAARGEQKVAESRILEIQDILKSAKIIRNVARTKVSIGCS